MTFDAVIIGGGIVGSACAYKLSNEGLEVALIEKDFVASGATSAGMGHIVVMDDSEAQFELTRLSRDLWSEIAPKMPKSAEYENCGTIWVAADAEELAEAERKERFYVSKGSGARVIGKEELYRLEPNLSEGLAGGLLVEDDSVTYQLSASKFFVDSAIENGARVIFAKGISLEDKKLRLDNGESVKANVFVNAAGLAAPALSPEIKIEPKKGHLVITDRYPGFVTRQIVELGYLKSAHDSETNSVAFNIQPRMTGQLLIGSSRQPGDGTKEVDKKILFRMLRRAFEYMPGLKSLSALRVWTGVRPATPDNLPYIGRSTTNKNVILAAGHEGLGITTSLGTAELVADVVFERKSRIRTEPFSSSRHLA